MVRWLGLKMILSLSKTKGFSVKRTRVWAMSKLTRALHKALIIRSSPPW